MGSYDLDVANIARSGRDTRVTFSNDFAVHDAAAARRANLTTGYSVGAIPRGVVGLTQASPSGGGSLLFQGDVTGLSELYVPASALEDGGGGVNGALNAFVYGDGNGRVFTASIDAASYDPARGTFEVDVPTGTIAPMLDDGSFTATDGAGFTTAAEWAGTSRRDGQVVVSYRLGRLPTTSGAYHLYVDGYPVFVDGLASTPTLQLTAPASSPPPTPTPEPDTVSISPEVGYEDGVFVLTGRASSAAGGGSVEVSAVLNDGARQDLGPAAVDRNGYFRFADLIGTDRQSFFVATLTDAAGGRATSADPGFSLAGGAGPGGSLGQQDSFSATRFLSTGLYSADGHRTLSVEAPGQTIALLPYDVVANHGQGGTTFIFDANYGHNLIGGFKLGGPDHDTLALSSVDFPGGLASVLRHAADGAAGVTITDTFTRDSVQLLGVTKAELRRQDFAFPYIDNGIG